MSNEADKSASSLQKLDVRNSDEMPALWNCTVELHCGTALWNCTAELHCGTALRNCTAELHCGTALRNGTVERHCGTALWNGTLLGCMTWGKIVLVMMFVRVNPFLWIVRVGAADSTC